MGRGFVGYVMLRFRWPRFNAIFRLPITRFNVSDCRYEKTYENQMLKITDVWFYSNQLNVILNNSSQFVYYAYFVPIIFHDPSVFGF